MSQVRIPQRAGSYKLAGRKCQSGELAMINAKPRQVGTPNPMRDEIERMHRGGEGGTPATTACPEGR